MLWSAHRTQDVNVNTASQRIGMCEARKKRKKERRKTPGTHPEEAARGDRMEGREKREVKWSRGQVRRKERYSHRDQIQVRNS